MLTISGNVLARAGVATPADQVGYLVAPIGRAFRYEPSSGAWPVLGGQGKVLKARAFPITTLKATNSQPLYQHTAYWVAETINIPDNTNIILQYPNKHLVIIAQNLKFGQNVTLTYERAPVNQKAKPGTPASPGTPAQSGGTGTAGTNAADGASGEVGDSYTTDSGPAFEIWTLNLVQGVPAVDARGQDGGPGGPGGDGARGGTGGKGKDGVRLKNNGFDGGPGGKGGRGGNGGAGGNGGKGGKVSFFSLQPVITQVGGTGYTWQISGGNGGAGGPAGTPGPGGDGGEGGGGIKTAGAWTKTPGNKGASGPQGDAGATGAVGTPGSVEANGIRFVAITHADFITELSGPHIQTIAVPVPSTPPDQVQKGDVVTVSGLNFEANDKVMIANGQALQPCVTQFISSTTLKFTVPSAEGGSSFIQVSRALGSSQVLSNKKSLIVKPALDVTQLNARMKPGEFFTLQGSGFKPNTRVYVSWGQNPPVEVTNDKNGANGVTYINSSSLKWKVTRPANKTAAQSEAFGEAVNVTVRLPDGITSSPVSMNYDNYVVLVVGDSMAWGTGLEESEKHHSQVAQRIQQTTIATNPGRLQLIKLVAAHTGAELGWNDTTVMPPIHGEVPTSYPTIKAEVAEFSTPARAPYVDFVIAFGGVNDIGFTKLLDPSNGASFIESKCDLYLYQHMKAFLQDALAKFTGAKIALCGYQLIFSPSTDFSSVIAKTLYMDIIGFAPTAANTAKSVQNSLKFQTYGNAKLAQCVSEINSQRLVFADPAFQNDNALYAPNTWLFTPTAVGSIGSALVVDPAESASVRAARKAAVDANHPARIASKQFGYCASAGHPNQAGASRYAQAIIAAAGL
jgi:hypothetical protein